MGFPEDKSNDENEANVEKELDSTENDTASQENTDVEEVVENATIESASPNPDMKWFILRVQSNKEDRVRLGLEKKIAASTAGDLFSRVVVPTELVSEVKKGQKKVVERKLYPGYVMVEMIMSDESRHIVKSTPGVGDFVGSPSKPVPMSEEEVERMLFNCSQTKDKPKPKISFRKGQNIKIKEGPFENFDGIVDEVNEQKGIVKVVVAIFGRYTQVELEFWQVESL